MLHIRTWYPNRQLSYTDSLFLLTVFLRIKTLGEMAPLRNSIEQLRVAPGGLWSEHIDFRSVAYLNDQQYHLNSLNAIL
jgi:hypothetical protein